MKTRLFIPLFLLVLTACEEKPLAPYLLEPLPPVYGQLAKDSYLNGKLAVGEFNYAGEHKRLAPLFMNTNSAVTAAFQQAGYLAKSPKDAKYTISGIIKDVESPHCLLASCDTGSAVEYNLTDNKTSKVVYHEMLVVPYTYEIPFMSDDAVMIMQRGFGGAIGNNIAHLLHVLNQKTKSDLQGS